MALSYGPGPFYMPCMVSKQCYLCEHHLQLQFAKHRLSSAGSKSGVPDVIQFNSSFHWQRRCQTTCIHCSIMYLMRLRCRTRRKWLPNVQSKRIISNILGEAVPLRLTTAALRCHSALCCSQKMLMNIFVEVLSGALWRSSADKVIQR